MTTENPKISVIVPVYRVEQYLPRCLDSIVAQTFTDWECILIDDGSPDNSGAICDEYAEQDSRFVVIHQENRGSAGARNTGLEKCSGKYIICVDSDDWVEPDYLEQLYGKAMATDADIVGCNLIKEFPHKSIPTKNMLPENSAICVGGLLLGKIQGWLHVKMIRRSLLIDNNISWVEGLDLWEDVLFSLKVFTCAERISNVDEFLYHYRFNKQSLVNTFGEKRIDNLIGVVKEIECFLQNRDLLERYYNDFIVMKTRVKVSILCESNPKLQRQYKSMYPEINKMIIYENSISKIKRIAAYLILRGHYCSGNLLLFFVRLGRKIKYR